MELSLAEAARTLGRSERQVRYLIKARKLKAKKIAGRWVVDSEKLPLSEGQLKARAHKAAELEQTVHDALGPHLRAGERKVFSVRDVHAFGHAVDACRRAREALGEGHAATRALESAVIALTRGSWNNDPRNVRCANRNRNDPDNRNQNVGFRLVCACLREHVVRTASNVQAMPRPLALPGPLPPVAPATVGGDPLLLGQWV